MTLRVQLWLGHLHQPRLIQGSGTWRKRDQSGAHSWQMGRRTGKCQLLAVTQIKPQQRWLPVQDQVSQNASVDGSGDSAAQPPSQELLDIYSYWGSESLSFPDVAASGPHTHAHMDTTNWTQGIITNKNKNRTWSWEGEGAKAPAELRENEQWNKIINMYFISTQDSQIKYYLKGVANELHGQLSKEKHKWPTAVFNDVQCL